MKIDRQKTYDVKSGCFRKSSNPYKLTGITDIIAIKNGEVFFIEVKKIGGTQSDVQKLFQKMLTKSGGNYYLVYSLDELKDKLKE